MNSGTSIIFGLLTAVLFASSALGGSRAVRHISQFAVVGWSCTIGLVLIAPLLIATGIPSTLRGENLLWWLVFGITNIAGAVVVFYAFRIGKVGLLAPIVATEGSIAAVLATLMGDPLVPLAGLALLIVVAGIVLTAIAPDPNPLPAERPVLSVMLAIVATLLFGTCLYASGRLSGEIPDEWLVAAPRIIGTIAVAIPLLLLRKMRMTRPAVLPVIIVAVAEVLAFFTYARGAQENIAITAVLSSQFAPLTTVVAWLFFKERLGRLQITGIAIVLTGVVSLTLVTRLL